MDSKEILARCEKEGVRFLRLSFTDIDGVIKNVEVPSSQFVAALEGTIMFDGSSIEGFTRIEESDMLLVPDLATFAIYPWASPVGKVARLVCDIHNPDGTPFAGCPRLALRSVIARAGKRGWKMMAGSEAEFFLFRTDGNGSPTILTHDAGKYFDLVPTDLGEETRRDIVSVLETLGFEVEAAHHEVAPGQHEIDFRYDDAIVTADNIVTFRFVVKKVALDHGLHATFMPKPLFGQNGSGMHTHQSLFDSRGRNIFYDPKGPYQLSAVARAYIAGILDHAGAFVAITNPLVNSYKRLVPGFEAPINLAYSARNRSASIRIPMYSPSPKAKRLEFRSPDPSCNGYLAFAAMLMAGLDGIESKINPGQPLDKDIYGMTPEELKDIPKMPGSLEEALENLRNDHAFLLKGDVFTDDVIETWIQYKYDKEVNPVRMRPSPLEFQLYFDI